MAEPRGYCRPQREHSIGWLSGSHLLRPYYGILGTGVTAYTCTTLYWPNYNLTTTLPLYDRHAMP
jgi:hypothetical protein